jgi:hypothetical protein
MTSRRRRRRDFSQAAKLVVDIASGQVEDRDLRDRLANRVQLTSDGHRPYLTAVHSAFGSDIDYAMLVKLYGADPAGENRGKPTSARETDL